MLTYKTIGAQIDAHNYERLRTLSRDEGRPMSEIVRRALWRLVSCTGRPPLPKGYEVSTARNVTAQVNSELARRMRRRSSCATVDLIRIAVALEVADPQGDRRSTARGALDWHP